MQTISFSWIQFHQHCKELSGQLKALDLSWDVLVSVTRGGLVPAAIISHELNFRHIDTVCISSYEDASKSQKQMLVLKELPRDMGNVLVIDDLADTGRTFRLIREMLPHAHFAAVYAKPKGLDIVQNFAQEVPQSTWIEFPWEKTSMLSTGVA